MITSVDLKYKNKYLKYKNKYLKLKGGAVVPAALPDTQSWFYMPLILKPFSNINVDFKGPLNETAKNACSSLGMAAIECDLETINNQIKTYYRTRGISLLDYRNLLHLGAEYRFDGPLHIPGKEQVAILENAGVGFLVDRIIPTIIENHGGVEFTFNEVVPPLV